MAKAARAGHDLAAAAVTGHYAARVSETASRAAGGGAAPTGPRLVRWWHPAILSVTAFAMASGFAQYIATATLPDVAGAFGKEGEGGAPAAEVGLSGTTLGLGLAAIRLASLASLPITGSADHFGRRPVLLACTVAGLASTAAAALSPSFWWFVALLALARPLMSSTNALSGVVAAEETSLADRAKAIALVTAGYGAGAGIGPALRGIFGEGLGFRALYLLMLIPLAAVLLLSRWLEEPGRYQALREAVPTAPGLRQLSAAWRHGRVVRARLVVVAVLAFAFAYVTGPFNTYLFLYAESVVGMSSAATALMTVLGGGLGGLAGLFLGRWAADALGRRLAAAATHVLVAAAGMLTYGGSAAGVVAGYLVTVTAMAAYAPAFLALAAELFTTAVRATASGVGVVAGVLGAVAGLLAFGWLSEATGGFETAAVLVAAPALAATLLFATVPETRGRELDQEGPAVR